MDFGDALFLPDQLRYRSGRSRPAGNRSIRSSSARSSGSRSNDRPEILTANGLYAPGPVGASLEAWGYVYQINTQTVPVGSNVNFSDNGPLNGITHPPGTATITVTAAGTYNLTFSVYTAQNNPQDWSVVVNGTARQRFNSAGQTLSGTTSLTLNAGDRVTIRNSGTAPDPATLRSGDFTTAFVLIYKVDS